MKHKKIIIGIIAIGIAIMFLNLCVTINRIEHYPTVTLWEELTLSEKIAAKLDGCKFETKEEQEQRIEKIKEQQKEAANKKAKEKGSEIANKIQDRIDKGEFTKDEYDKFDNVIFGKLMDNELTIEEVNILDEKLANGKINIQEYIK
ncbi:UNVERIFIED_ORG: hypothetical protein B2H98_10815 [Clostridium botulinum]